MPIDFEAINKTVSRYAPDDEPALGGGAQTFPAGVQPAPDVKVETIQAPGLTPPSPNQPTANGATPAPDGSVGTAGGGVDLMKDRGTPDSVAQNMGPGELEQTLEASASHVAKMKVGEGSLEDPDLEHARVVGKKTQINDALVGQGANPQKAIKELRTQRLAEYERMHKEGLIDKKTHTKLKDRWKNIFNIIPKEDFGMVLMDFGFRAMMAGESMGSAGAIGAAGAGALQGVETRRKEEYGRKVGAFEAADKGARADRAALETPPETINTEQGVMQWDIATQSWKTAKSEKGETLRPSSLATRAPVDKWKIDQYLSQFPEMTEQEATRRVMSGVTPETVRTEAERAWDRFANSTSGQIFINGVRKRSRDIGPGDKERYIDERLEGFGFGPGSAGGSPALDDGSGNRGPLTAEEQAELDRLEAKYGSGSE